MAKRDQHGPKAKGDNISWTDVIVLVQQLQAEVGMRVDIHIYTEEGTVGGGFTRVDVRAFSWDAPWITPKHRVSSLFETRKVATMTGLLVRMLHQLDHVIYHARMAEEAGRGI